MAEDDGFFGHGFDHGLVHRAFHGKAEEDVGPLHGIGQGARLGVGRVGRFPLVHALFAALIDDPRGVAHDDVVMAHAHPLGEFDAGDGAGPGAVDHHLDVLDVAPGNVQRVKQRGGGDDGGAVLIVMEDRDIHQFPEALLDDEAFRRLDVFQVDAGETGAEMTDAVDEFVDVLGPHLEVDGVDIGETLEQDRLALHHRLGGQRAQVTEPENRRPVGYHRHQIAPHGVVVGLGRIVGDGQTGRGDAGGIGEGQVVLRDQRLGGHDFDLPGAAPRMEGQGLLVQFPVGIVRHDGFP